MYTNQVLNNHHSLMFMSAHVIIKDNILSNSKKKYIWEESKITRLIREKIDAQSAIKTQREIAAEIGFDKPQALSMFKRGEAKVPLERLPQFSLVLDVDLGLLFRLGLEQWWPGEENAISKMVYERVVTANDRALLKLIRTYLHDKDPEASLELLERLRRGFAE